jgi:NADH:ubiquinone oxidoreductase subunit 4 (subunit M)
MVILIFWIGLYPNALLGFMHESVAHLLTQVHGTDGAVVHQVADATVQAAGQLVH